MNLRKRCISSRWEMALFLPVRLASTSSATAAAIAEKRPTRGRDYEI